MRELQFDEVMKKRWKVYQTKNTYAKDIEYENIIITIKEIINILIK